MTPEDLRNLLVQPPFAPFRIHLTDGRVYDVRHREMVWVGRRIAVVGVFAPDGYLDRHDTISLLHIVSLEPIQTAA
jgi:hypothetical protein